MNMLILLISRTFQYLFGRRDQSKNQSEPNEKEHPSHNRSNSANSRNFDDDYRAATMLLKTRMDRRFPDNYQARLSSGANSAYDHGEDRAAAIDTASAAIAMALREGASVKQAADAGAASIGI